MAEKETQTFPVEDQWNSSVVTCNHWGENVEIFGGEALIFIKIFRGEQGKLTL